MAIEIERKFLVDITMWRRTANSKGVNIQQGYLSLDPEHTVRIRITDNEAYVTIKGKNKGITRSEWEYPVPLLDGMQMLTLCENIISKTRYTEEHNGLTWEIDEFHDLNEGLVIAELELDSPTQLFDAPRFLLEEVVDPKYFNSNLTTNPYTKWN